MSTVDIPKFACEACGKQFAWKPEFAGKRAKCNKCGTELTIPRQPRSGAAAPLKQTTTPVEASLDAGMYDVADDGPGAVGKDFSKPAPTKASLSPIRKSNAQPGDNAMYDIAADSTPAKVAPKSSPAPAKAARHPVKHSEEDALYDVADDATPALMKPSPKSVNAIAKDQPVRRSPPAPQADDDAMYDVAEELEPAKSLMPRPAPMAAGAGVAAVATSRGGPVLPYGGGRSNVAAGAAKAEFADSLGGEPWRELWLPAGLVLMGVFLQIVLSMRETGLDFVDSIPTIGIRLFGGLILCFAGMAAVARAFDMSFGAPGPAILKAAAGCLLPPAIGAIVGGILGHDSAFVRMMVASLLMMPLTWLTFWWLFNLEYDEAIWLVVVIWMIQQWVITFLLAMILSSGEFGGMMGAGAGGSSEDQKIAEVLTWQSTKEAKAWLGQTVNRTFGGNPNAPSLKMVQDLYTLGAQDVSLITDGPESSRMIVTLPKDKAQRKMIFDWCNKIAQLNDDDPVVEEKQKYVQIYPPPYEDPNAPPDDADE